MTLRPTPARPQSYRPGFTLVELLVVIGIIALLVGILLPTLGRARESSKQISCASNLRSVGQGFAMYTAENNQYLPAAYVYTPRPPAYPSQGGGTHGTRQPGYTHWSWFIFGDGESVAEDAFLCPNLPYGGGLPASNPALIDLVEGQVRDPGTDAQYIDEQVRRIAFTVNEAIIPRNKFLPAGSGVPAAPGNGGRRSQRVSIARVKNSTNVIMATEFPTRWEIISDFDSSAAGSGTDPVIKSHRPVHGYLAISGEKDINNVQFASNDRLAPSTPPVPGLAFSQIGNPSAQTSRLDWVGRNHQIKGRKTTAAGETFELASTNFLFVDGHIENKTIEQTLPRTIEGTSYNNPEGDKFQWGNPVYALEGAPAVVGVPFDGD